MIKFPSPSTVAVRNPGPVGPEAQGVLQGDCIENEGDEDEHDEYTLLSIYLLTITILKR
jgi:hypothetical protein